MNLDLIAQLVSGELTGENINITGLGSCTEGQSGEITFAENDKALCEAESSQVSAIIVPKGTPRKNKNLILVDNPRLAFSLLMTTFAPDYSNCLGIHPSCVIHPEAQLGKDIYIGPLVIIEKNAVIEDGVKLLAQDFIGTGVKIGAGTIIHPNVTILRDCVIGKSVIIYSGAVIGSDGFGYVRDGTQQLKIPQLGKVVVEDLVEIGANSCIDRATLGETHIGKGTKIDNLVHIGHNVKIGEDSLIIAQVGIAGSCKIGNRPLPGRQGLGPISP
jgi:UDP-3-O-[3-hydroxymyristoyl] glucosamine N-acyltransferase